MKIFLEIWKRGTNVAKVRKFSNMVLWISKHSAMIMYLQKSVPTKNEPNVVSSNKVCQNVFNFNHFNARFDDVLLSSLANCVSEF